MSDIEKLVRPFQLPSTAPARPFPTSQKTSSENALLSVGGAGTVKTYQINFSHSVRLYMTKQEREVLAGADAGGPNDGGAGAALGGGLDNPGITGGGLLDGGP